MNWFIRIASDEQRIANNIQRLEDLHTKIHELAWFAQASGAGSHMALQRILGNNLVLGRPLIHDKLKQALTGENNQKIALDAPNKFQGIMFEAESIIKREISQERRDLQKLTG